MTGYHWNSWICRGWSRQRKRSRRQLKWWMVRVLHHQREKWYILTIALSVCTRCHGLMWVTRVRSLYQKLALKHMTKLVWFDWSAVFDSFWYKKLALNRAAFYSCIQVYCTSFLSVSPLLVLGLYRSSAAAEIRPFFTNPAEIRLRPKLGRIWNFAGFGKLSLNNTNLNVFYMQNVFPTIYNCSINGMCHFVRVR